jgi:hypothetical protein
MAGVAVSVVMSTDSAVHPAASEVWSSIISSESEVIVSMAQILRIGEVSKIACTILDAMVGLTR